MKKGLKKKKGSALLIAIMLSAVFAAAIVGVNAMAIRQLNTSKTYSNGLVALYTAESGVEEGLLRYRFNKNAEVPANMAVIPTDPERRIPALAYRNFLDYEKRGMISSRVDPTNLFGEVLAYSGKDMSQVYALQLYYGQKYFGAVDANDLRNLDPNNPSYKIIKDESKTFTIPTDQGNLALYWRWLQDCNSSNRPHALEIKLRVSRPDPVSGQDTYTAVFNDTRCRITNGSDPSSTNPGTPRVDVIDNLKGRMNITSKTIVEMTLHPVSKVSNNDGIIFGYSQDNGNTQVAGPITTVRSIGFYRGTTREMTANIDRQSGTILDLFNYVLYKGGN